MENNVPHNKAPLRQLAGLLAPKAGRSVEEMEYAMKQTLDRAVPGGADGFHARDFYLLLDRLISEAHAPAQVAA